MLADPWAREHVGEEQALVDLDPILLALAMSGLGVDLFPGRNESGNKLSRRVHEVVEAAEHRAPDGEARVNLIDMGGEKCLARGAGDGLERIRGRLFGVVAPWFGRKRPKQSRR